jgi:hypothetical protein
MRYIVDIHTRHSARSKGDDPLGVGNAMRRVRAGRNFISDYIRSAWARPL